MTSFFDKLKKGMSVENLPDIEKSSEPKEILSSKLTEEKSPLQQNEEVAEEMPEKISPVLATAIATGNSNKPKTKKQKKRLVPAKAKKKNKKEKGAKNKKGGNESRKIKIEEVPRLKMDKSIENEKNKKKKWPEQTRQSFSQNLGGQEGELTVDVYQTDEDLVIQSVIAGITPENLDISIENDMLVIKGNREKPTEKEERNYFFQECYWGPFSRELVLPEEVDNSRIQASLKNGVLTIRIPKIERGKKRKVNVKE